MNFYGSKIGSEHTLAGRLIPLLETFNLAIERCAKRPVPDAIYSKAVPAWCHTIADQLAKTIFKDLVDSAPQREFHPRKFGRIVGMLLRSAVFVFKDAPAQLEQAGLVNLSPAQKRKLESLAGYELLFKIASERFGGSINTKAKLVKAGKLEMDKQKAKLSGALMVTLLHLVKGPVELQYEFLCGIPEGFVGTVDTKGDFARRSLRFELYVTLLMYWPEIAEMQKAQPPVTRRDLLEWLNKEEGREIVQSQKQCNDLCDDIGLTLSPPGHPRKTKSR
jgi:hypothetical protein